MALSGVHVACLKCASIGADYVVRNAAFFAGEIDWSENMASAGTTANKCPANDGERLFEVNTNVDIYFSYGANPNPNTGPRLLMRGGDAARQVSAKPGDKLAWVLA